MDKPHHNHLRLIKSTSDFLYRHFKIIMLILVVFLLILTFFINSIPTLRLPILIFITIIFLVAIPNFIVKKGLKSIYNLIGNKKLTIGEIIWDYCLAALSAILFFAILYGITEYLEWGYLQYGGCDGSFHFDTSSNDYSDQRDPSAIVSPFNRVYFSATTFFTVGYGDICPMGYSKLISVLNALVGSLINILVISIAVGQYLSSSNKE